MENEEELVSEIYDFLISQGCVNADTAFSMAELLNANMKKKRNLGHLAEKFRKHKLITLLNRHSNEFGITYDDKGIPEGVYADPAASHAIRAEPRHAEPRQSVVPLSMFLPPSYATGIMSDPNRYTNPKSSDYNPFHMPYSPYVEGSQSLKHPEHMPRGPSPPQRPSGLPHNPYVPGWYDDAMHPMHRRASAPPGGNKKSRCKPNKAKKSRSKHNASKTKKRK